MAAVTDPHEAQAAMLAGFRSGDPGRESVTVVTCPSCHTQFDPATGAVRTTEATEAISGQRSTQDTRSLLNKAVEEKARDQSGTSWAYAYVRDFTDTEVVYDHDGKTWQCPYTLAEDGTVGTVALGEPAEVVEQTWYVPAAGGTPSMPATEETADMAEAFDAAAHPRVSSGPGGGQFTAGGGGAPPAKKAPAKKAGKAAPKAAAAALGYAGGAKGTGYGQKGGDARVKALQTALNRLGLTDADGKKLAVDGKFGPRTTAAVKKLQKALGLKADGKVTADLLAKAKRMKSLPKAPAKKAAPARRAAPAKAAPPARRPATARRGRMAREAFDAEMQDRVDGRVMESLGTDDAGGRIFRVRIIQVGASRNGRRYTESVLRSATSLYEGAKAYDHHRTADELRTSTIHGLVGSYRNVEAETDGLYGDLHLLPSATHTAEALDATLAAEAQGLPPLVGISHDVMATYRPVIAGGKRMQEATAITKVHSADVVADPAAGGRAVRMVAGGTEPEEETAVPIPLADVLAAFAEATDDELAAAGLTRRSEATEPEPPAEPEPTTESAPPAGEPKTSWLAKAMIRQKAEDAGLTRAVEALTDALPERVTESDVDAHIAALKAAMGIAERAGLAPTATAQVTQESMDKKTKALDAFFARDWRNGYRSFREAFVDITGRAPRAFAADFNRTVLRESMGDYDSAMRSTESMDSTSWAQILGDSVTRRMVAEYAAANLNTWRLIVNTVPVQDFRTQRVDRMGGYGVLPTVNQGAPYQPLTSPGDEEVTYTVTKKGGTEDITLEMIANDDVKAIANIPRKLGRAAAQTLYRFVWDFLPANAATSYDSTALFHTDHANTDTSSALSQTTVGVGRRKMIEQTAYGDTSDTLGLTPKYLVVPPELEELAFQLCTSAVAIPATPASASDSPNIHAAKGLTPILVPYYTDANDWYLVADPADCPTIEVGFYQGREDPELFTQSDPNVGSMFNADSLTWKIRHIYSGALADHRAFYRGVG